MNDFFKIFNYEYLKKKTETLSTGRSTKIKFSTETQVNNRVSCERIGKKLRLLLRLRMCKYEPILQLHYHSRIKSKSLKHLHRFCVSMAFLGICSQSWFQRLQKMRVQSSIHDGTFKRKQISARMKKTRLHFGQIVLFPWKLPKQIFN